jgi:hypothetical protein
MSEPHLRAAKRWGVDRVSLDSELCVGWNTPVATDFDPRPPGGDFLSCARAFGCFGRSFWRARIPCTGEDYHDPHVSPIWVFLEVSVRDEMLVQQRGCLPDGCFVPNRRWHRRWAAALRLLVLSNPRGPLREIPP